MIPVESFPINLDNLVKLKQLEVSIHIFLQQNEDCDDYEPTLSQLEWLSYQIDSIKTPSKITSLTLRIEVEVMGAGHLGNTPPEHVTNQIVAGLLRCVNTGLFPSLQGIYIHVVTPTFSPHGDWNAWKLKEIISLEIYYAEWDPRLEVYCTEMCKFS